MTELFAQEKRLHLRLCFLQGAIAFELWQTLQQRYFQHQDLCFPDSVLRLNFRDHIAHDQPHQIDAHNNLSRWPIQALLDAGFSLAEHLLEWQGRPLLRFDHLLDFQEISMSLYVDQLTAAFLALKISRKQCDERHLLKVAEKHLFPEVQNPELADLFHRGLIELHQHYNASQLATNLWNKALEKPKRLLESEDKGDWNPYLPKGWRTRDLYYHLLHARVLRQFLIYHLVVTSEHGFIGHAPHRDPAKSEERQPTTQEDVYEDIEVLLKRMKPSYKTTAFPICDFKLPHWVQDRPFRSEIYLLTKCFSYLHRCRTYQSKMPPKIALFFLSFYYYLCLQNIFQQTFVQQDQHFGFESFSRHERAPAHQGYRRETFESAIEEYQRVHHIKATELRLVPKSDSREQALTMRNFFNSLDQQQKLQGVLPKYVAPSQIPRFLNELDTLNLSLSQQSIAVGFNFHVVKEPDPFLKRDLLNAARDRLQDRTPVARHHNLRKKVFLQLDAVVKAKQFDKRYAKYCLGIDAANDELFARPEVFAPAFRYAKDAYPQIRVLDERRNRDEATLFRPLRITFHAGESFDHLLSGIRYVDEALTFLEMRTGDRIGHGLALGVDPRQWVHNREAGLKVKPGEWLDSLVWMHETLSLQKGHGDILHFLNNQIERLLPQVYSTQFRGHRLQFDKNQLHQAWLFRAQEASTWVKSHSAFIRNDYHKAKRELIEKSQENVFRLWLAYHFSAKARSAYVNRTLQVIQPPNLDSWINALTVCQEVVMKKMIDLQIAIEVNPTSNLRIGPFNQLTEHPIFRWNPVRPEPGKRSGPVCTINGDNYAIFQTTLPLEYAYLARAAQELKYHPSEIAAWLNQLRVNGFKYTFLDLAPGQNVGY